METLGWLRAALLGTNHVIPSPARLMLGIASAHAGHGRITLTGIAGLTADAMSAATGV